MKRRIHSFIWGGLAAAAMIALGLWRASNASDYSTVWMWIIAGVAAFAFVSCLILNNNFVGEMFLSICEWGFIRMPGVIFTLDLDGLIWLLTVKLLFWVLGIMLAIACGILGVLAGLVVSIFVYPSAIIRNLNGIEEY